MIGYREDDTAVPAPRTRPHGSPGPVGPVTKARHPPSPADEDRFADCRTLAAKPALTENPPEEKRPTRRASKATASAHDQRTSYRAGADLRFRLGRIPGRCRGPSGVVRRDAMSRFQHA